jgi:hypothetical protein
VAMLRLCYNARPRRYDAPSSASRPGQRDDEWPVRDTRRMSESPESVADFRQRLAQHLRTSSPTQLMTLYSEILDELSDRRVIWSRNPPVGNYAELLVAKAFGGNVDRRSQKSWDVQVENGDKLQVKSVVLPPDRAVGQFSVFRSTDFTSCVFVVVDSDTYRVRRAVQLKPSTVLELSTSADWVSGVRVTVAKVLASPLGTDVTLPLRRAQAEIDSAGNGRDVVPW